MEGIFVTLHYLSMPGWLRKRKCATNGPVAEALELMGNPKWADNPRYRNRRAMKSNIPMRLMLFYSPGLQVSKEELRNFAKKDVCHSSGL